MNKSKIDQLVNQYINSASSGINSITTTGNYYPGYYQSSNISSWPDTISSATTWSSSFIHPGIDKILTTMPLILRIKNVSVDGNKIEISFDKFSHKNWDKFLPDQGTVYFGEDIYGVYDKADYLYWEDTIKVQVEDIDTALKVIKNGILFTTVNNWDERITNQEIFLFLKSVKTYKRYAHILLETFLDEDGKPKNLKQRMKVHSELESRLL